MIFLLFSVYDVYFHIAEINVLYIARSDKYDFVIVYKYTEMIRLSAASHFTMCVILRVLVFFLLLSTHIDT